MERLGRKRTITLWNCLAGVFLLACIVDHNIVRTLFYLLSKLLLAGCIILLKVYTNEVAPASNGSNLYMYCDMATRFVGMGVPFLLWLNSINYGLVYAVAGGAVLISPMFLCCLPETKGRTKPETVHEFISLYYGSRYRSAQNGHAAAAVMVRQQKDQIPGSSRGGNPQRPQRMPNAWQNSNGHGGGYSTVAEISNMGDAGNLSMFDPDIERLKMRGGRAPAPPAPQLESTRISEHSRYNNSNLNRQRSLPRSVYGMNGGYYHSGSAGYYGNNGNYSNGQQRMARNASYESSLNTMMSDTPTYSGNTEEELIKRNSLVSFTPKTSVKKHFSLSKV
eukprot:sb/3466563/